MAKLGPRDLPALHRLLAAPEIAGLASRYPRERVRDALREELAELRQRLARDEGIAAADLLPARIAAAAERRLGYLSGEGPRRVINATGVVLHTNLGRAPIAPSAAQAAARAAAGYSDLEFQRESGRRGSRQDHLEGLLRRLTGAPAALVVNNNAAAVFLLLRTFALGRETVISRGELVEIGGSFRIPDVLSESGSILREVGTTNRTHLRDYERAIGPETAALLRVHPSNFRQVGFTARVAGEELAALAHREGILFLEDLGSGALVPIADEPTAMDVLGFGADLVTMSGDKLLGGPQAGIVLGREDLVARLKGAPLYRALRPDKMTIAALAETLRLYLRAGGEGVPAVRMLQLGEPELRAAAGRLAARLRRAGVACRVVPMSGRAGGGSLPETALPSWGVALAHDDLEGLHRRLRLGAPGVVGRIEGERLLLDVRTLLPGEAGEVAAAVAKAFAVKA